MILKSNFKANSVLVLDTRKRIHSLVASFKTNSRCLYHSRHRIKKINRLVFELDIGHESSLLLIIIKKYVPGERSHF